MKKAESRNLFQFSKFLLSVFVFCLVDHRHLVNLHHSHVTNLPQGNELAKLYLWQINGAGTKSAVIGVPGGNQPLRTDNAPLPGRTKPVRGEPWPLRMDNASLRRRNAPVRVDNELLSAHNGLLRAGNRPLRRPP